LNVPGLLPFLRRPSYALLLRPLGLVSYPVALNLWLALQCAAFLASAYLIRRLYGGGFGVWLMLATFSPVSDAMHNGQDSGLLLCLLLFVLVARRARKGWLAAVLLAIAFQKFSVLTLMPLVLVVQRDWPFLKKLVCCLTGLAFLDLALVGPAGIADYFKILQTANGFPELGWNIRSLVAHFGWPWPVFAALTLLVAAGVVPLAKRLNFEVAFWASVRLSILAGWHAYSYDLALALPFFYIFRSMGSVAGVLASCLLYGGLWVSHVVDAAWAVGAAVLFTDLLLLLSIAYRSGNLCSMPIRRSSISFTS
jgi:hypothetical protein